MVASTRQSAPRGWGGRGWSPGTDPAASGIHASTDPETFLKKKQFTFIIGCKKLIRRVKR